MRHYVLILLLCLPACRPPVARKADPAERLLGLVRDRLEVMHDVARRKWADRTPIEDPAREESLLQEVAERGKALGLAPDVTREFFAAQIEAAKVVQRADFRHWEGERRGPAGEAPDLTRVLRPRIDALNRDLLAALAEALPRLPGNLRERADRVLAGVEPEARELAIRPLLKGSVP